MRVLTHLKVAGTKSFRLAASQLFEFGINAQNSDKDILDMFAAPDGWCIVQVDQAGAEALVVAYLASHGKYRDLFLHGVKPHVYVALHLFLDKFRGDHPRERYWLRPPQELKTLPEWKELVKVVSGSPFEYDIGKRTGHAKNYEMGPHTFQEAVLKESEGTLVLDFAQAKYFLDTYAELFPEVIAWQAEIKARVRTDRMLRNLQGYPRRFEQLLTDGYLREAISWIPQSTVGCITHIAYRKMYDYIRENRLAWKMLNNKHDSFAAMVPDEDSAVAVGVMSGFMEQEYVGWDGSSFKMRVESQVGKNFKKYSAKNPLGLKNYP